MSWPKQRDSFFSRGILIAAAAIGVVAALGLWLIWLRVDSAKEDTLAIEAGKTLMQVIGVVLLGALLSHAVNSLTMRHQDGVAIRQLLHTSVEAERVRNHSNWQRRVDQKKDQRLRLDDLRRSMLESTIDNYNEVKRARRRLRTAGDPFEGTERSSNGKDLEKARVTYAEQLDRISEAQLQFERLSKLAALAKLDPCRLANAKAELGNNKESTELGDLYEECKDYLKALSPEGFSNRPGSPEHAPLSRFLAHRSAPQGFGEFSTDVNTAVMALRAELTAPIDLPKEKEFEIDLASAEDELRRLIREWAPFGR